jgi:3D (Asp-Asp-Asp) domain-containing protein
MMGIRLRILGLLLGLPLAAALLSLGVGWSVRYPLDESAGAEAVPWGKPSPSASVTPVLPLSNGDSLQFRKIVLTGYTSSRRETDSTPFLTASMTRTRQGCLALSRDLLRTFTPDAPYDFGDYVLIPGVGVFIVEDTMHARWRNRGDIWFADRAAALRWGRRRVWMARMPKPIPAEGELLALGLRPGAGRILVD